MYLTRFRINSARRGARHLLSSPQVMHAAVLAGFPGPSDRATPHARTLWRVDHGSHAQITLYIVSPTAPDLTHLVEQAGWPTTETWQSRAYDSLLDSLKPGQEWAFRLTANPVRSGRSKPADTRTRRFGHVTVAQQQDWLLSRAKLAGFTIPVGELGEPDVIVHNRMTHTFRRQNGKVTIQSATYDGRLEVADPDALRRTLTLGLGHAKAYGCGLLTLAPVSRNP
jgi:CRISPR system Cascade subunit CasE